MPRFLSPEWVEALVQIATAIPSVREAAARVTFTVSHVVIDGPDGTVSYWLRLAGGRVEAGRGKGEEPDVTFTHDYATAVALSRGELTFQEAALAGRVKVSGHPEALVGSVATIVWAELAAALTPLRAATTY